MAKKKPVKEFRLGNIKGSIWLNEDGDKVSLSVSLVKSYRDDKGEWHDTASFWPQELPVVMAVAQKCLDFVMSQELPKAE